MKTVIFTLLALTVTWPAFAVVKFSCGNYTITGTLYPNGTDAAKEVAGKPVLVIFAKSLSETRIPVELSPEAKTWLSKNGESGPAIKGTYSIDVLDGGRAPKMAVLKNRLYTAKPASPNSSAAVHLNSTAACQ